MHMTGLAKIAAAMANRGSFDGVRILGEKGWNFFSKEILSFYVFGKNILLLNLLATILCIFPVGKYVLPFFAKINCLFL